MKKEVCLMCIVCFFLGYFVCDVIGKCGFKKPPPPPPPPPPHEDFGDFTVSSESLPAEEFGDYNVGSQQFRSSARRLRSESDSKSKLDAQQLRFRKFGAFI